MNRMYSQKELESYLDDDYCMLGEDGKTTCDICGKYLKADDEVVFVITGTAEVIDDMNTDSLAIDCKKPRTEIHVYHKGCGN